MARAPNPPSKGELLPPFDADMEEAIIGSLLLDGEAMPQVASVLEPLDFFREKNAAIYQACLNLYQAGVAPDQLLIAQELQRQDKLDFVGGPAYLIHCLSVVPTSLHIEHYAGQVKSLAQRRKLIAIAGQIAAYGYEGIKDAVPRAIAALTNIGGDHRYLLSPKEWAELILAGVTRRQTLECAGLSWGWSGLDELTGGLAPGDLVLVGARPSMGKTTLLQQAATSLIAAGKTVLFFSAEMTAQNLGDRQIALMTGIPIRELLGRVQEAHWAAIQEAVGELAELPIWVAASRGVTSQEIRSLAEQVLARVGRLDLVVVDYLQILGDREGENQNVRVSRISANLSHLAKELNIPVLVASQLSRGLTWRQEKRPTLADLRDSGSLEQDADIVLFLHREDYYYRDEDDYLRAGNEGNFPVGEIEIIQAKHRQFGEVRYTYLKWDKKARKYVEKQLPAKSLSVSLPEAL